MQTLSDLTLLQVIANGEMLVTWKWNNYVSMKYSLTKESFHIRKFQEDLTHLRVHIVFDVKHDGRHKAWLVADGHLTQTPVESVYSGVVSLRGFRMCLFIAELNNLQTYVTDIGNAFLESYTTEKLYVKAGSEFGDLEGHLLIASKKPLWSKIFICSF